MSAANSGAGPAFRPRFRAILLLGSFDPDTRALLEKSQALLAKTTLALEWPTMALLVDGFEIYTGISSTSGAAMYFIVESGERSAAHIVEGSEWIDSVPLPADQPDLEEAVTSLARQRFDASVKKLPILEKLRVLSAGEPLTFLVRDKELTRGGEYIELAFILGLGTERTRNRMWFMHRQLVPISKMAEEILDMYGVASRTYATENELLERIARITLYQADR